MYTITKFGKGVNPFRAEPMFACPKAAIAYAKENSVNGVSVQVGCCARGWLTYENGSLVRKFSWEDFYTGNPEETYAALVAAL